MRVKHLAVSITAAAVMSAFGSAFAQTSTGEQSQTISVYAIDAASGALKLLDRYPTGKGSNWVEMVATE